MASPTKDIFKLTFRPTLEKLKKRHDKRMNKLGNLKTPYKKASIYLDRWVQTNFRTEGGNVGGWTPFKYGGRVTTKSKAKAQSIQGRKHIDPSAKLMQDTGRLKASFLPFASSRNAGIGSDLPYAKTHDKGLKGAVKRRLLPVDKEVMKDIETILKSHIKDSIK